MVQNVENFVYSNAAQQRHPQQEHYPQQQQHDQQVQHYPQQQYDQQPQNAQQFILNLANRLKQSVQSL